MKPLYTLCLLGLAYFAQAQEYYYPPLQGNSWETISNTELGWCDEKVDSLLQFLEERDTKAFILLKNGRMALEQYYGTYTQDSLWYWASAGKSLMGVMMGLTQEDGLLDIEEPISNYLGEGWTSCTAEEENNILIRHQISMASGLDDSLEETGSINNCFDPECFVCIAAPETRWAYHNSAYRLSQDVMETATGFDKTLYTRTRLGNRIGMAGFWFNYIYFSTARDMARFGHLILSEGSWDGDQVMADQAYYQAMISPSQEQNKAYGYLWWLNGQESYQLPGLQFTFSGSLIPNAPDDMFAALGRDDQKIYVVPSLDMVVVRQGLAAGGVNPALSSFDNLLWEKIMNLDCLTAVEEVSTHREVWLSPNPTQDVLRVNGLEGRIQLRLYDLHGQMLQQIAGNEMNISEQPTGVYVLQAQSGRESLVFKVFKK